MKHTVTLDTRFDSLAEQFVGNNQCTCGWRGESFDIAEIPQRESLEAEARQHRMSHKVASGLSCVFLVMTVTWLTVIGIGAIWLLRSLAGW